MNLMDRGGLRRSRCLQGTDTLHTYNDSVGDKGCDDGFYTNGEPAI